MSRERLPIIGSSRSKTAAKLPHSSSALQRSHQANQQKRSRQPTSSTSSSHPHPHPGPTSILHSDTTMAPWGGLILSESSFPSIQPPPPPRPPPPPPAPQPTPSTPNRGRQNKEEETSSSSFKSEVAYPPLLQGSAGVGGQVLQTRRRLLPQHRVPRPPRLPQLHPVTNLSFSRSFTFSFFELPLHQSPHCRAERIRNLMLLLRQIHY